MQTEAEPEVSPARMRLMAVIIATALFMQNLDSTVISTALPAMAQSFHAVPLHMSVALTSYLISLSVFIPASGWVADHFGARQVFRGAIVIFTVGSVLCGVAGSVGELVAARIVQGLGGAMMLPVGRLLLLRSVSRKQMVDAMAWLTMPALVGPVLGPPLGGFIVSYFSWRWVFDINVPIGIIGAVAVSMFIPDVREPDRGGKLDLLGLVFSGLAMAFLMAGFETVGRYLVPMGWTIAAFLAGAACCLAYAAHARRTPHPVLDFSLLAIPTFVNSMLAGSLFRIAVGALPFLLPLMLQLAFGYTPLQSGLVTFAAAAGALLMKPAAQPLLSRFGFRTVLIWNGAIAAAMMGLCALFQPNWPSLVLDAILFTGGFFRSLQFTAYNTIAYGDVPRPRMSAATTLYATVQQLTLTLGIVAGAFILEISTRLQGHKEAVQSDYAIAFVIVSAVAMLAAPLCARLPRNAGEALSGHHPATEEKA
ncbi:MFS transporter [Acidocella aromatica]|uniref:EmrB/QacA subfamily drug resistance transporter n=1 Tax=Acidocella aromatica TaxID=1303579 RepID=A0A840V9S3_9PROT|nr:MFS transporter [Acidocella aromatica]MBB5372503.1 EmrB/QacA subfamily drug resistance transporter [Acidocella aromatica]